AELEGIARDARLIPQQSPVTIEEYSHASDFAAVYREVAADNRALLRLTAIMPQWSHVRFSTTASALHAHNLRERMHHVHQISLVGHDLVDILVGARNFVDDVVILAAFHALGLSAQVIQIEAFLGCSSAHRAACAMRAG